MVKRQKVPAVDLWCWTSSCLLKMCFKSRRAHHRRCPQLNCLVWKSEVCSGELLSYWCLLESKRQLDGCTNFSRPNFPIGGGAAGLFECEPTWCSAWLGGTEGFANCSGAGSGPWEMSTGLGLSIVSPWERITHRGRVPRMEGASI